MPCFSCAEETTAYLLFIYGCEKGGSPTIPFPIKSGLSTNKLCDATVAKAAVHCLIAHSVIIQKEILLSLESLLNPKRIPCLPTIVDKET